jgi:hypothetical protein
MNINKFMIKDLKQNRKFLEECKPKFDNIIL